MVSFTLSSNPLICGWCGMVVVCFVPIWFRNSCTSCDVYPSAMSKWNFSGAVMEFVHLFKRCFYDVGDIGACLDWMCHYIWAEIVDKFNYVAIHSCGCRSNRPHCVAANYLPRVGCCIWCFFAVLVVNFQPHMLSMLYSRLLWGWAWFGMETLGSWKLLSVGCGLRS